MFKLRAHESMTLVSVERLQPSRRPQEPITTPLSFLDTSTATFAPATAVWTYRNLNGSLNFESLANSLRLTLSSYPQWCGHMGWADETKTRFSLTYGTSDDPGLGFTCYNCTKTLDQIFPSLETMKERRYWQRDEDFDPSAELVFAAGQSMAAPHMDSADGLPVALVQLTRFSCGGIAIAVRLAHVLSDALCLGTFVQNWSLFHRGSSPSNAPLFEPSLLDKHIETVDEQSLERVKHLPLLHYDLWASGGPSCPEGMREATEIPSDVKTLIVPLANKHPWHTWDMEKKTVIRIVYFSPEQLKSFCDEANKSATIKISQHDAIMARVWSLMVAARESVASPDPQDNIHHLGMLIGFRGRVSPPLPDHFVGSPVNTADVSLDFQTVTSSFQTVASSIRSSLSRFDSRAACDMMYEVSKLQRPYRQWNGFFGSTHTIATSWLRTGKQDIQFEDRGEYPHFVYPVIPYVDGCVCLMEAEASKGRKRWTEQGAVVRLSMEESAMERFIKLFLEL